MGNFRGGYFEGAIKMLLPCPFYLFRRAILIKVELWKEH